MKLKCFTCGEDASTEVPDDIILRGVVTCPDCIEDEPATEADYLNMANLVKLRIAATIVRDCLGGCGGAVTDEDLSTAAKAIQVMTGKLENAANVREYQR